MKAKRTREFDAGLFLATIGEGRKIVSFEKGRTIFAQGGPTDSVFYVQKGKIKLTVVSHAGKKATVGAARAQRQEVGPNASNIPSLNGVADVHTRPGT